MNRRTQQYIRYISIKLLPYELVACLVGLLTGCLVSWLLLIMATNGTKMLMMMMMMMRGDQVWNVYYLAFSFTTFYDDDDDGMALCNQ